MTSATTILALLPVLTVIGVVIWGLVHTGWDQSVWNDTSLPFYRRLSLIIGNANSYTALLWGSFAGLLVAVLGMQALSYSLESYEQSRKMQTTEYTRAKRTLSEQAATLSGYYLEQTFESEGPDQPEELVGERIQIPIDRAKELILKELGTSGGA
jgi:hypothetical protein